VPENQQAEHDRARRREEEARVLDAQPFDHRQCGAQQRTEIAGILKTIEHHQQGVPGAGGVSADDVRKLQEEMARLGQGAGEALAVPRENVELFRKHEAEIKKYAMTGLALVGL